MFQPVPTGNGATSTRAVPYPRMGMEGANPQARQSGSSRRASAGQQGEQLQADPPPVLGPAKALTSHPSTSEQPPPLQAMVKLPLPFLGAEASAGIKRRGGALVSAVLLPLWRGPLPDPCPTGWLGLCVLLLGWPAILRELQAI